MDQTKIEDFIRDHPGEGFLKYRELSNEETALIRRSIAVKLDLVPHVSPLELVKTVANLSSELPNVNAEDQVLDLRKLLGEMGITLKERVLINWYRFDDIDELNLDDVSKYLSDLWYPR